MNYKILSRVFLITLIVFKASFVCAIEIEQALTGGTLTTVCQQQAQTTGCYDTDKTDDPDVKGVVCYGKKLNIIRGRPRRGYMHRIRSFLYNNLGFGEPVTTIVTNYGNIKLKPDKCVTVEEEGEEVVKLEQWRCENGQPSKVEEDVTCEFGCEDSGGACRRCWLTEGIVAGMYAACAISVDGELRCWGDSLGILDSDVPVTIPIEIEGFSGGISKVGLGFGNACALIEGDSSVQCWGKSNGGVLGNGQSSGSDVYSPAAIAGLEGVKDIAVGNGCACAVQGDGYVKCWGGQQLGKIGKRYFGFDSSVYTTASS